MISAKELLIAIFFLYISFSIGILLKFIPLRMNFVLTFILAFLTPFLLIIINFYGTMRYIAHNKLHGLWKEMRYDFVNIPAVIASIGELFAEVYARQLAKKNVYKKFNIKKESPVTTAISLITKGMLISVYNLFSSIANVSDHKEKILKAHYDEFKIKKTH